jgi:hypothetical protein
MSLLRLAISSGNPANSSTIRYWWYQIRSQRSQTLTEWADPNGQFEHINAMATAFLAAGATGDLGRHREGGTIATSKQAGVNGSHPVSPNPCACTTFLAMPSATRFRTGCTTWRAIRAWVSVGARSRHTDARRGGHSPTKMDRGVYPPATDLYITADAGGTNGIGHVCGRQASNARPTTFDSRFTCRTFRLGRASGTRLSTGSSVISRRTDHSISIRALRPRPRRCLDNG